MLHDTPIAPPPGYVRFDPAQHDNPWPELDPSLLEDMRAMRAAASRFTLLPEPWARWMADTAQAAGTPTDYVAQGVLAAVAAVCGAGVQAQVTDGLGRAAGAVAGAGRLAVERQVAGARRGAPPARRRSRRRCATATTSGAASIRAQLEEARSDRRSLAAGLRDRRTRAARRCRRVRPRPSFDAALRAVAARRRRRHHRGAGRRGGRQSARRDPVARRAGGVARQSRPLRQRRLRTARTGWRRGRRRASPSTAARAAQPLHLANFPVSVIGSIQPDRLAEAFVGQRRRHGGALPLHLAGRAPKYRSLTASAGSRATTMRSPCCSTSPRFAGTPSSRLCWRFDDAALEAIDGFMQRPAEGALDAAEGLEASWLGKGRGTVARLAGDPGAARLVGGRPPGARRGGSASRRWATRSACGSSYFRPHAATVFSQCGRTDRDRHARKATQWLKACAIEQVSREELRREALGQAVDAGETDGVIRRLEAGGVIRLSAELMVPNGGRPAKRWTVNPTLR